MPFTQHNGIRYYTFNIFPESVAHAVFTRQGGVSPTPWDSLNVGGSVGDDPARVRENRLRSFAVLGRTPESIYDVWQVHSARAVFTDAPRPSGLAPQQADVILTDRPNVTLFMRFADCVPILLSDPIKGVVGLAHAGWLGTLQGVATEAIKAMQTRYNSQPEDILAAIGPSIGPDHYEIGPDVVTQVSRAFYRDANNLMYSRNGCVFLDLWAANRLLLNRVGVRQIEISSLCTACHPEDWYSHRAQHGCTGRFGALIFLQE